MKQKLLCVLFLFLQFSYAQTPGMDVLEKERQIKRTLNTKPDSARVYIREILHYKGRLHDTVYANAYTSYGYTHNLKNSTDSSLYYYNKALSFLSDKKFPAINGRVLRNKASAFRKKGDYNGALQLLDDAEQYYRTAGDSKGIALVYGEMASNYNMLLRSDDAIKHLLKAIAILEKTNDKTFILSIKLSLANTYMNLDNLDFALDLYKEILEGYRQVNMPKNYAIALINYGDCLRQLTNYNEALKAFLNALPIFEKFEDQELVGIVYSKLGKIKLDQGKTIDAEKYFKTAFNKTITQKSPRTLSVAAEYLSILNDLHKKEEALKLMRAVETSGLITKGNLADQSYYEGEKSETYLQANKQDVATASAKYANILRDTVDRIRKSGGVLAMQENFQKKYQTRKSKKLATQNSWLHEELYESRLIKIVPLLCLSFLLVVVITIYAVKNKTHRKKLIAAKAKKDVLLAEYEKTRLLNKLRKENIEIKQKELVSDVISIATLEGGINSLITHCSAKPSDVCIKEISAKLQELASDDDYWKVFRKHFNENYEGFQYNLSRKFPVLTKNDLFFCSLLKLNLPYKDMALLMQVSPESIVKKKYRIKKRMGIENEQDLDSTLLNTSL